MLSGDLLPYGSLGPEIKRRWYRFHLLNLPAYHVVYYMIVGN
jgi:hypothetical protein